MPRRVVLYVEDSEDDALLMELAFKRAGLSRSLCTVGDGRDAIKYLAGENSYCDRERHPLPALVLLDLNLPVMTGFQVMEWMRQRSEFRELPVVVFSSSDLPSDKARAKELGAKQFIEKPSSAGAFGKVVEGLREEWKF